MRVRANTMAIDSEDPQLADEYVQEFVLDHLDLNVKRENLNNNDQETNNNNISNSMHHRLPSIQSMALMNGPHVHIQSPPHHLLTPPGSGIHPPPEFQNSMLHGGVVMRGTMYPGTPGTPPDTPPGSNSPPHQHYLYSMDHPHIQQLPNRTAQNVNNEENMMWIAPNPLREPLDLRPHYAEDWGMVHPHGGKYLHDERPLSVSSSSVMSPMSGRTNCNYSDDHISDDLLMCLSVRDLNKRLNGYPKDQIQKLKAKRRTLKNRGYAQNCRSKRLHQRHELEVTNKHLAQEIHKLKSDCQKLLQERNHYKKKYDDILRKECAMPPGEAEHMYV